MLNLFFGSKGHKVPDQYKDRVKAEVIFLTHSEKMHLYNLQQGYEKIEQILWRPQFQELKQSGYGGAVLRYRYDINVHLNYQIYEYGFLGSVTEFVDHERRAKSTDQRLETPWFDNGIVIKQPVLDLAD